MVGLDHLDAGGALTGQQQLFGRVLSADSRSTGEVVVDPDYFVTFSVQIPRAFISARATDP